MDAKQGVVIAIDGPAGAGKSTLAREVARRLNLPYINTGLMYRALAERALIAGADPGDGATLAALAQGMRFSVQGVEGSPGLLIDGRPPAPSLSSAAVEAIVSRVSSHPQVRSVMRHVQRRLGVEGSVMEGRDIGTVVFPDADLKIFLSAQSEVRARRRERERGGGRDVAGQIARRDALDAQTNPLVPAEDAHVLDTTALPREEVLVETMGLAEAAGLAPRAPENSR